MFNWDDLRYFLAIHRGGTLTQAAEHLRINPTTAGRRLHALEEGLGARLFDRTPDGFVATAAGLRLVPVAERMEAEVLALERDIAGDDQRLEGTVRLTATEMLATRFIAPHLGALRRRYPDIHIELISTSADLDLSRREADVSLRLARPKQDGLVIKRLAAIHLGLYATPKYFERVGRDAEPGAHELLGFAQVRGFERENEWLEQLFPDAPVVLRSTSVSSVYSACTAGMGLALLPRIAADRDPRLERLPTEQSPQPRWIWQAVHQDLQGVARVRAVLDFIGRVLHD